MERRNREEWGIQEVVPPLPRVREIEESTVIEVDPAYIINNH